MSDDYTNAKRAQVVLDEVLDASMAGDSQKAIEAIERALNLAEDRGREEANERRGNA